MQASLLIHLHNVSSLGNNHKHNLMKQRKGPSTHRQSAKETPHLRHGGPI